MRALAHPSLSEKRAIKWHVCVRINGSVMESVFCFKVIGTNCVDLMQMLLVNSYHIKPILLLVTVTE